MIKIIEESMNNGMTMEAACNVVGINTRRLKRWKKRARTQDYDRHKKPKNIRPINALTPEEKEIIKKAVASEKWADMNCRELSVRIMEEHGVYVSHMAIWEYQRRLGISGHRGKRRNRGNKRPPAPDTSFVKGPNQLWSWDITKIRTGMKYVFWYLYVVLDWYSRKVVGWHLSERENSHEAQIAWDNAILSECVMENNTETMPRSLSDRGSQMRSKSTRDFFKELGIEPLFARPRTPNDNAQIESLFATTKTHPDYPGYFEMIEKGTEYFKEFFRWYNEEHLHTRIGMVTPEQRHSGEWVEIQEERDRIKATTFAARRKYNKKLCVENKESQGDIS